MVARGWDWMGGVIFTDQFASYLDLSVGYKMQPDGIPWVIYSSSLCSAPSCQEALT